MEGGIFLPCALLYVAVGDKSDPVVRSAALWVYCNRLLYITHVVIIVLCV